MVSWALVRIVRGDITGIVVVGQLVGGSRMVAWKGEGEVGNGGVGGALVSISGTWPCGKR